MVQVETSQLTAECSTWRDALRQYREKLTSDKTRLQEAARHSLSKDQLQQVEHLQNQFHIQLINIHDLKHFIKSHLRTIDTEMANKGHLREETVIEHEHLFAQYQDLDSTLIDLRSQFERFLASTS